MRGEGRPPDCWLDPDRDPKRPVRCCILLLLFSKVLHTHTHTHTHLLYTGWVACSPESSPSLITHTLHPHHTYALITPMSHSCLDNTHITLMP